ncbi:uncharacterized protein MELLADRAFT_86977 [Melampsora larici-populina 98AG31]|uniref:Uncharacterized protein n=1 Tax=Melampsora larici-populina (strain 98AG31 / pathotype 3-4-7) TaxID=747676 RepID=F4R426_MELLP|nr:uncharacterized protein MELLADRAFT_86977 [Melampsora larici-populina 98AG31]EGG13065.1 hypothetical protein MELLADRAFT_86977 [Melampsora larici-populina 98AG31]
MTASLLRGLAATAVQVTAMTTRFRYPNALPKLLRLLCHQPLQLPVLGNTIDRDHSWARGITSSSGYLRCTISQFGATQDE